MTGRSRRTVRTKIQKGDVGQDAAYREAGRVPIDEAEAADILRNQGNEPNIGDRRDRDELRTKRERRRRQGEEDEEDGDERG